MFFQSFCYILLASEGMVSFLQQVSGQQPPGYQDCRLQGTIKTTHILTEWNLRWRCYIGSAWFCTRSEHLEDLCQEVGAFATSVLLQGFTTGNM